MKRQMSEHANRTVQELRKFGFAFTGGLTVLGSLLLWRGKAPGPYVLGAAALVLTMVHPQAAPFIYFQF